MAELVFTAAAAAIAAVDLVLKLWPSFSSMLQPDLDSTRSMLETMQAFLRDSEGREADQNEQGRKRVLDIHDLAYEIEDIVETFLLEVPPHSHQHGFTRFLHKVAHPSTDLVALHRFSSAVNKVDAKIKKMRDLDSVLPVSSDPSGSGAAGPISPVAYPVLREDELVGIDRRASKIEQAILEGGKQLAEVTVVGPHGSGKTSVLKEVFKRVKGKFKRCVWIDVQSTSNSKTMLETVVAAVMAAVGRWPWAPREMDAGDRLVYLLHKKRYALFFDGISRKVICRDVMSLLPDNLKGSRVIISSHEQDVTTYCARLSRTVLEVESLTWEENRSLLCKIAFPEGVCPQNLVEWTRKLVKKCEGLPVAIVVAMSRLLSTKIKSPAEFEKFHDSIGRELGRDVGKILLPSYTRLNRNKKCCFLSFSNFPEDHSVTRGKLIRLWIAERFVKEESPKTLEEVAEKYLNELVQTGLVLVSERDCQGNVRSCRVQNLVRGFILSKFEEEEICSVLTRSGTASAEKIRRMPLQKVGSGSFLIRENLFRVRSLMMFTSDSLPRKPLEKFGLLRILDFEDANLQDFPEEIVKLRNLGHLSLRNTKVKEIPKSIKKLQSLVTLDIRQTLITNLPSEISKLQQLVYLLVSRRALSLEGVEVVPDIRQLKSLQKLSLVKANRNNWNSFTDELKSMTELRKLGISGLSMEGGKALCKILVGMRKIYSLKVISASQQDEELVDLGSLEPQFTSPIRSLYLAAHLPCWISSLDSLAKLHLQWSRMTSSQLEVLQALPSLVKLKLSEDAYAEYELVVKASGFGNLKMLELEDLSLLKKVEVWPGGMPQLTDLVIRGCQSVAVRGVSRRMVRIIS